MVLFIFIVKRKLWQDKVISLQRDGAIFSVCLILAMLAEMDQFIGNMNKTQPT